MNSATLRPSLRALPLWAALVLLPRCTSPAPVLDNPDLPALGALADQVDGQRLMNTVKALSNAHGTDAKFDVSRWQENMRPDSNFFFLSRVQARDVIEQGFQDLGFTVQRQDASSDTYETRNLIAELPGTTRPNEVVLIGAHYDAFYSAADDNSTGVAAVLELARIFSSRKFDRTLRFVAFDLEELGAIGSHRFVAALNPGERLVNALVFDCIGYASSEPGSQGSVPGLPAPDRGDFIAVIANDTSSARAAEVLALSTQLNGVSAIPLIAQGQGIAPFTDSLLRSDHSAFWLSEQSAVFFTDTANFRNPNYHRPTDTLDTLDPDFFRRVVQLSATSVAYWAGGPR